MFADTENSDWAHESTLQKKKYFFAPRAEELIVNEMVKYDTLFIFLKGTTMKAIHSASKILLLIAALSMAFAGCERRSSDQTSGSSGSSGTSGTSKSGSSDSSGSSSGGSGTNK